MHFNILKLCGTVYQIFVILSSISCATWAIYVAQDTGFPFNREVCPSFWTYLYSIIVISLMFGIWMGTLMIYRGVCNTIGNKIPPPMSWQAIISVISYIGVNLWNFVIIAKECVEPSGTIDPRYPTIFKLFTAIFMIDIIWLLVIFILKCSHFRCNCCPSCCREPNEHQESCYHSLPAGASSLSATNTNAKVYP